MKTPNKTPAARATQQTPGVREDRKTGQFVPTLNGKDISPTSFSKERALQIAHDTASASRPDGNAIHHSASAERHESYHPSYCTAVCRAGLWSRGMKQFGTEEEARREMLNFYTHVLVTIDAEEFNTLMKQRDELAEALEQYGTHHNHCHCIADDDPTCKCEFTKALAAAKGSIHTIKLP